MILKQRKYVCTGHLNSNQKVFKLCEKLGEGSYGTVYRALHVDGFEVAAKIIKTVSLDDEALRREIEILR